MNEEQRLVYVRGMLLQAEIKMHGMVAENDCALKSRRSIPYREEDFNKLIEDMGVHHNALMTEINGY